MPRDPIGQGTVSPGAQHVGWGNGGGVTALQVNYDGAQVKGEPVLEGWPGLRLPDASEYA